MLLVEKRLLGGFKLLRKNLVMIKFWMYSVGKRCNWRGIYVVECVVSLEIVSLFVLFFGMYVVGDGRSNF